MIGDLEQMVTIEQCVLYATALTFKELSEALGDLVADKFYISQVIYEKEHNEFKGYVYKAIIIASKIKGDK